MCALYNGFVKISKVNIMLANKDKILLLRSDQLPKIIISLDPRSTIKSRSSSFNILNVKIVCL